MRVIGDRFEKRAFAMAMHGHSAACCSIPPIVAKGYEGKGKYETIGGLKTCKCAPNFCFHFQLNPQSPLSSRLRA